MKPTLIDPGERIACVLGAKCVLTKEIERVTADQRKRLANLEKDIGVLAKQLCQGSIKTTWPDMPPYKWLDENLARTFDVEQVQQMISNLDPETQLPYMTIAQRQFDFLQQALPRPMRETLSGPIAVPPDPIDLFRFAGLWRVIDDPTYVFQAMAGTALLRNQAQSVRLVFPTLAAFFDDSLEDAIVAERTKDSKWEMPWRADAGVRDWRGMPTLLKPFQVAFVEGAEVRDAQQQPSKSGVAPESKASLSAAQSALYGQVGR